jgi:predicted RecA/RadA family phage recombinase
MKNYIQTGNSVDYVNQTGSPIRSGDVVIVGNQIGIAAVNIAIGSHGQIILDGVFTLSADSSTAFNFGDALYWDANANQLTTTATANTAAGICVVAKQSSDTIAVVRLQPASAASGGGGSGVTEASDVSNLAEFTEPELDCYKVGSICSISLDPVSIADLAGNPFRFFAAVPGLFRPSRAATFAVMMVVNGTSQLGRVVIQTNGNIDFFPDFANNNFGANDAVDTPAVNVAYQGNF